MISPFALVGFFLALASTHVSGFSFSKRADTSKITSPQRGDGITTGIDLDIRWESASSEDSVNIELRKGLSHNLTTVHTINNNTPNNGSYYWRSRDDNFLRAISARTLPNAPISGCDYVIAIREGQSAVYSDYFTILNLNDDGLNPNIPCPGKPPPKNPGGGGEDNGGGVNGGGGTGSQNNTDGPKTDDGKGATAAMLGGAVGGAAVGLLVIFATVLLLGRQRNWFVNEGYIQKLVEQRVLDLKPVLVPIQPPPAPHMGGPYEFSGEPHAHQLPVTPAEK
ncbi:hypothetical protein GX50_03675 [[Emmonsia] crescens]|uniref:Yeast cell wall synthesis Kre9/Knh1-like N-terminal domain-containing protein n=1 Tax=[Emmonsia] crescens TaxID=73230 RepID=A0A2B7ZK21_9EURO|nr:hypothetical protein GX50_03675 [Emmonsia crescens]